MKRLAPLSVLALTLFLFLISFIASAGNDPKSWTATPDAQKVFIENKGQFHINNSSEKVLYAYDNGSTMIYFSSTGVT
ncbi:MAG: hypothetical protein ACXVP4_14925, partial [Bacteroidia bacterium]